MLNDLFIFGAALFLVIKGATLATRYAAQLAESYNLSKYAVGFIIVAVISIFPETLISLNAALEGVPAFGLGVLFGSNVADLTVVFAAIVFLTGRSLKVESKVLKSHVVYPFILILPLVLGLNGHFSRLEGLALMLAGAIFYYLTFRNGTLRSIEAPSGESKLKNFIFLVGGTAILLTGAHFTVTAGSALAAWLGVSPILIGMLVVGLGTTIPEFFFALKSAEEKMDSLAAGDILGTVLADATIVVGLLAFVTPFYFPKKIIYITGVFMVVAAFTLLRYMYSGHSLTRREAAMLFLFWLAFLLVEFAVST